MRFFPLFAAVALLTSFGSIDARAGACDKVPDPVVTVTSPRFPVVLDRTLGTADLTAMMAGRGLSPGDRAVTLGITSVQYATTIRFDVQINKPAFGKSCGYPIGILVQHGYSAPMRVYLARELRDGTCKYRTTYDHEMQHVEIHEDGLRRAKASIERAVVRAARLGSPVYGGSREEISGRINEILTSAVETAINETAATVQSRNDAMDTPDAYRALGDLCPNG